MDNESVIVALGALAQATRLDAFRLLVRHEPEGLPAGEVAKALDYAHQRNVVHHDVKPGNVLLAHGSPDDEQVLLSDFGVARAAGGPDDGSDDSTLAVTLAYAAPEVITGDAIDGRADIYSLACTLFRLTPLEALAGVTVHAARALGIAHESGTLEAGKLADFALWEIDRPGDLAYALGARPCRGVVNGGQARPAALQ